MASVAMPAGLHLLAPRWARAPDPNLADQHLGHWKKFTNASARKVSTPKATIENQFLFGHKQPASEPTTVLYT